MKFKKLKKLFNKISGKHRSTRRYTSKPPDLFQPGDRSSFQSNANRAKTEIFLTSETTPGKEPRKISDPVSPDALSANTVQTATASASAPFTVRDDRARSASSQTPRSQSNSNYSSTPPKQNHIGTNGSISHQSPLSRPAASPSSVSSTPPKLEEADYIYDEAIGYLKGEGVDQDYAIGAELLTKAARQGHREAQYKLGVLYSVGAGVHADPVEACRWYHLAAAQGHTGLDLIITRSLNNPVYLSSICLFEKKKMLGFKKNGFVHNSRFTHTPTGAQHSLGDSYRKGDGVTADDLESARYYRLAADQVSHKRLSLIRSRRLIPISDCCSVNKFKLNTYVSH
jgi:hypothetical protein